MATTGFWPVKSRLKEVIDYAENPDKTIDKKYVDRDLYAALQYVSNDNKTDERMYVSGINCNAKRAYERMTVIRAFRRARLLPKKRTKSDWKPQGVCGAMTMKSLLPPTSIPKISTIIL